MKCSYMFDCTLGVNYFRLFLRLNMSIFSNYKSLIQEQFINLTNNIRINYTKLIGVIGVVQALEYLNDNRIRHSKAIFF